MLYSKNNLDPPLLTVSISKKLTNLLQPLDQTTNGTFRNNERREFSYYFSSTILKELIKDLSLDMRNLSFELQNN